MDIKYNVYYSLQELGPWTLANNEPLDHNDDGNAYTVSGLQNNTAYYFTVIGGTLDDDDNFVPLVTQFLGPTNQTAGTVNGIAVPTILAKTYGTDKQTTSSLGHEFTVTPP